MPWIVYTYPKDVAKHGDQPVFVSDTAARTVIANRRAVSYAPPICQWCGRLKTDCPPCADFPDAGTDCGGLCTIPKPEPAPEP